MTSEYASPAPRYATLRDYLRVLRRYWIMIVVLGAVGAVAGFVDTIGTKPNYQASSEVAYQDPTQGLNLVGLGGATSETPAQLAAIDAETITRPSVMDLVRSQLHTTASLTGGISAQVGIGSGLLQITATAGSANFAAQLANAVAGAVVQQDNAQTRSQVTALANSLSHRVSSLSKVNPNNPQLGFYENELARLQTLGAFIKSAQIAEVALPGVASSTSRARNILLGLALGLLLGVLVSFLRDSLDRRLRSAREFETSYDLPVLGHVRESLMGKVAHLPADSVDDGLIDLEAIRILRRNVEVLDSQRAPRSIVVTSALPQEGKTTIAASLALAIAANGRRVLLVDGDLRRPALAQRLKIEQSPGLSDYLYGEAGPQEILRTIEFTDPPVRPDHESNGSTNGHVSHVTHCRLVCIPSGAPTPRAAELLGSARFREFLREVSGAYDTIVIDSSPLLAVADTLEMIPEVDAVLICARECQTTRDQARAARAALARFPARPSGLVLTGVTSRSENYETYAYAYGYS